MSISKMQNAKYEFTIHRHYKLSFNVDVGVDVSLIMLLAAQSRLNAENYAIWENSRRCKN